MRMVNLLPKTRNLPQQLVIHDSPIHQGGEGKIYFTQNDECVVKIYHKSSTDKQLLLQRVIDLGRNLGEDERFLAWPLGVVSHLDGEPCVGVVSRRVSSDYQQLHRLMYSPRDAKQQFIQGRSWLEYLKIARGVTVAVRTIHGKGIAHSDIQPKNFLANPVSGEVVLVDLDGVVVKGFLLPQVKGVRGFIAPEVLMHKNQPNQLSDRHSLAVLVLWTLLFRNVMQTQVCYDPDDQIRDDLLGYGPHACFSENPNDRQNWISTIGTPLFRCGALSYHVLSPALQNLTERALIEGLHEPTKRPQAVEWERALSDAYDLLITCSTCRQSFFYPYWLQPPPRRQCPFCGVGIKPPFPAVLQLYEERSRGSYVRVRPVVLYHGLPIFRDMIEPGKHPPFTRRGTPVVGETVWDPNSGSYRLLNKSSVPWQVIKGGKTGSTKSISLKKGIFFKFGPDKRVAQVVE